MDTEEYTDLILPKMEDDTDEIGIIKILPSPPLPSTNKRNLALSEVPAYFEPFKYGWKRKLVYRTIKINKNGRPGPAADVCYIGPNGQKFWSFKRLKQYLYTTQNSLTVDNFTYVARALGLNDESKEIFDYSRQLISGDLEPPIAPDSASELTVKSNETNKNNLTIKTPTKIIRKIPSVQTSRTFTNKSLHCRQITKRKLEPKLKITRIKQSKVDIAYVSANESIQSKSTEDVTTCKKNRFEKYFRQPNSMQALIDYHKSLQSIFNKLEVADLLRVRLVCTTWRDIADKPSFWNNMNIEGLKITDWDGFAHFLESHKTKHLNMEGLIDGELLDWEDTAAAIARTHVTDLVLNGCSAAIVEKISEKCEHLQTLTVTLMNADTIDLNNMDKMHQHKNGKAMQVSYESLHGINLEGDLAPLLSLSNLTHLTLKTLKNLTTLKLGEGLSFSSTNLQDLRYLRLERVESRALISFNVINGISSLTKLEHLELIDFDVEENFDEHLQKCKHLKSLLLIPAYSVATSNRTILKGILSLKENLKYVIWGVHSNHLRKSKLLIWKEWQADNRGDLEFIPIIEPVPFLYLIDKNSKVGNKQERNEDMESPIYSIKMIELGELERLMMQAMPKTVVSILKTEKFRPAVAPECKESKFYTVFMEQ